MQRVIVYIDGFNLYFGLKSRNWKRYYWLNLQEMAKNLLSPNQQLVATKYFTSRISGPPDKARRQSTFLDALGTLSDFEFFYGRYQQNKRYCRHCGKTDLISNEKMTDVNTATEMMADAFANKFDTAIVVSADADLTAPISKIRAFFGTKTVVVAFPPKRSSFDLQRVASATLNIGRGVLAKSVFPPSVQQANGHILTRPAEWI